MKRIIAVTALVMVTTVGLVVTGTGTGTAARALPKDNGRTPVSRSQYETLLNQCSYAATARRRAECRDTVRQDYRAGGEENPDLDCREYSGVSVCGRLRLSPAERACVRDSVAKGLTYRRAEVECYAFT
ncbi:hypothetical protein [Streptosporangium sp. NPDC000239]|uniref:Secreted protein n=1 Tax=Streptosporangium jomthongense TaxID=1193683 RepID=A0ABV8F277_9ACTN